MKRTWVKVICLTLALALCGAGAALAAKKAEKPLDVGKALSDSFELLSKQKYAQAEKILNQVLAQDPGNPLALNNLAAVMVNQKKYPAALSYLEQALPRAKGYKIRVNRVCDVQGICLAFRPLEEEYGNQELEPLIKLNMDMVKDKLKAPSPAK